MRGSSRFSWALFVICALLLLLAPELLAGRCGWNGVLALQAIDARVMPLFLACTLLFLVMVNGVSVLRRIVRLLLGGCGDWDDDAQRKRAYRAAALGIFFSGAMVVFCALLFWVRAANETTFSTFGVFLNSATFSTGASLLLLSFYDSVVLFSMLAALYLRNRRT